MAFRTLSISDLDPVPALDGALLWHPLRHALGVTAFGVNAYTAPSAGRDVVEEHTEGDETGGHEELYVVLSGCARFTIDGEQLDAPAGTCVFLPDPTSKRYAVALEDATRVLAVGGEPGKPFEVSAWEWRFRASPHIKAGEWERALEILTEGLELNRGDGSLLYNVACCEAQLGRLDDANAHLAEALADDPRVREWGAEDTDLDPLRERPDFPLRTRGQ
jgi:mannose-6-phosphate isomerase-like protein (cupin superfamily)